MVFTVVEADLERGVQAVRSDLEAQALREREESFVDQLYAVEADCGGAAQQRFWVSVGLEKAPPGKRLLEH